jgi:two-component system, OmpR family, response regulator CpxR
MCCPETAEKIEQGASPLTMRPKKVILCVDDNEQELSVLKFMLKTNGYRVLTATNGQEATAIFASTPQIDLVLTDHQMPHMSGSQLVERLKRMAGHVPMILVGDTPVVSSEIHVADAALSRKNCSTMELLDLIKRMSTRKRGPRKGAQRMVQVVDERELAAAS